MESIFNKIKEDKNGKATFWVSILIGAFSYIYILVNDIYNHDNILFTPKGFGEGIGTGRWFLEILGHTSRAMQLDYSIPLFKVALAILFVGIVSVLMTKILEISNYYLCLLIGGVTMVYPSIAGIMMNQYSAPYNMFGLLLMVAGTYCAISDRKVIFYGAPIMMAFSLGIYQAYLPLTISLFMLYLIRMIIEEKNWKKVIVKGLKFCGVLLSAYIIYRILLTVSLSYFGASLRDYKGVDEMGQIDLQMLPKQIIECYKNILKLPFRSYAGLSSTIIIRNIYLLVDLGIILYSMKNIYDQIFKKKAIGSTLLFGALLFTLPIGISFMNIMVSEPDQVHTLMALSYVCIFYLFIMFVDCNSISIKEIKNNKCIILASLIIWCGVFNYSYQANGNFRALYYLDQQVENYYTIMMARIQNQEGYHQDLDIVLIGHNIDDQNIKSKWDKQVFDNTGEAYTMSINTYARRHLIENLIGYTIREIDTFDEEYEEYEEKVKGMDSYPNDNSIRIADNEILVYIE